MNSTKEKAAISVKTEAAFKNAYRKSNSSLSIYSAQASPTCGKAAAISVYCWGVLPLENCTHLFRQHPEWRHA